MTKRAARSLDEALMDEHVLVQDGAALLRVGTDGTVVHLGDNAREVVFAGTSH